MKPVGRLCKTLLASEVLQDALTRAAKPEHFPSESVLFQVDDKNAGVFFVRGGAVRLRVPDTPQYDRTMSSGSVLGLPSTLGGGPYSLTAECITDCEIVHVGKRKFLKMMNARPDLCQEITDILSAELRFILSVFRKYPRSRAPEVLVTTIHGSI
jgi:CRP-like cAMP-binding protein